MINLAKVDKIHGTLARFFIMSTPSYSLPLVLSAGLARDIVLLRRRDFRRDAIACVDHLKPPLKVLGSENIPQHGPCVVTVNHYHRPGFAAQWLAIAIAALIPIPMHWVMTGEFTYPGKWYQRFGSIGSQILLKRIAYIYDFMTMPPMPPRPGDVEKRAASVRAVLKLVKAGKYPILGLAPEGYDPPTEALTRPASGLGRFGLLLSKHGMAFIPVGAYEADGVFHVHFGKPYVLTVEPDLTIDEKDERSACVIMQNIAHLLPQHLRGDFA